MSSIATVHTRSIPMSTSRPFALAALLLAAAAPRPASAAGFALFEQGARGMGFAGAFTAQASDPSAIFHNAAGVAFLEGTQIYLGDTRIAPRFEFTGAAPFPGPGVSEESDIKAAFPPAAYVTHRFSPRFAAGVGFNVPFGLESTWADPDRYSGRYISTKAQLHGFSVNPTLAYQLSPRVSIGAGVDFRLASVNLQRRVPVVNPFTQSVIDAAEVTLESETNKGVGFNVGLLAKLTDTVSVGASYRSQVGIDFEGTSSFVLRPSGNAQLDAILRTRVPQGALATTTHIDFPAIASFGIAKVWNKWTVEADVNWYGWSSFDQLPITLAGRDDLSEVVEENYDDSFQFRIGLQRVLNEAWTVRGGYFRDQSPAPSESVSPLLPDADRNGFALGLGWKASSKLHVDAASWLVLSPERSTEGVSHDQYNGTYEGRAFTLGVSVGYTF
jgi:long-chain fatty acid transport protein